MQDAKRYASTVPKPRSGPGLAIILAAILLPATSGTEECSAGLYSLSRVQTLSTFWMHTCAIVGNSSAQGSPQLYCWGLNDNQQLGVGGAIKRNSPTHVNLGVGVTPFAVSAGKLHTCSIVTVNGGQPQLNCWGAPTVASSMVPAMVILEQGVIPTQLASSWLHTCMLATGGSSHIYCWGTPSRGRLGLGDSSNVQILQPTGVSLPDETAIPTGIAVGQHHTCVTASGGSSPVYCWGENINGQLGLGTLQDTNNNLFRSFPVGVGLGAGVTATAIASGALHTCVMATGGASPLLCWGRNNRRQLGVVHDTTLSCQCTSSPTPIPLPEEFTPKTLALGAAHTCLINTEGFMHCWGWNIWGQLGSGARDTSPTLAASTVALQLGADITATSARGGVYHTCAILAGGDMKCWGQVDTEGGMSYGQLGYGRFDGVAMGTLKTPCACPAQQYRDSTASQTCQQCATDSSSLFGSDAVADCMCNVGYTGPDGGSCTACGVGTYKARTGAAACNPCPANSSSPVGSSRVTACSCSAGWTGPDGGSCSECSAGKYKTDAGAAFCDACPSMADSPAASNTSTACQCKAGWTNPHVGPDGGPCTECVAGKYKIASGDAACTNCSAGQYSTAVGATSDVCQGCPTNSNAPEASDEEVDCTSTVGCLPGFTKKEDHWWDPCVNCERGKYKSFRGSGPCNECPEHASTEAPSQRNSTSINDCECLPGFFGSAGVCKICPVDTYKEELGNFVCVECPLHTASPQGSTTNQMCTCKQNFLLSEVFACACCVGVYGLACVFVFAWACVCVFVRACMYTCWYVHERKCLYMHTAQTCTCMQLTQDTICRSLCLYVYIYVHGAFHHTHTHTHIYIHTHKLSQTHINYERIKPHLLHHWSC